MSGDGSQARAGKQSGPYGDEMLRELVAHRTGGGEEPQGAPTGVPFTSGAAPASFQVASQANNRSGLTGPVKVRYSHQAMADMIIQNPWISQGELAAHFGYTQGWVCQVIASDAFQAYLNERKGELVDPAIRATIDEMFKGLVRQSILKLQERLAANPTDDLLVAVMNGAGKALGYGARPQAAVQVNNYVAVVPQKDPSTEAWAERVAAQRNPTGSVPAGVLELPSSGGASFHQDASRARATEPAGTE